MGKLVTAAVALLVSFFSYRAAHLYFIEKKLRHSVWTAIDPASSDDAVLRDEILLRSKDMNVRIDPDSIKVSSEEIAGSAEPSGTIQVVRRVRTVSLSYEYRMLGAAKSGTLAIKRHVAVRSSVAGEGATNLVAPLNDDQ